jgi:16S rRNA (uracil1498-N3)-methyltransferase
MARHRLQKAMSRFFGSIENDTAIICGEEAAHMVRTLRMRPGDVFTAIDGGAYEYDCIIEAITSGEITANVQAKRLCAAEPEIAITLYQAYPKAAKMETILQKCVEIGVSSFVPFLSERCVKKPEKDDTNKISRLQKVAQEAVKQCGRCRVIGVSPILSMKEVLKQLPRHTLCLLAWEEEKAATIKEALRQNSGAKDIALIIGPEGGFSPLEAQSMQAAGAMAVSLGRRILRTETAGMAACAMIMYEMEE